MEKDKEGMEIRTRKFRLTFLENALGTTPLQKDIFSKYIQTKKADLSSEYAQDELESIKDEEERGTTGFPRTADGKPFVYDYTIKGFLKDSCQMLNRVDGSESKKLKAFKKTVDGTVFVDPRKIVLNLPQGTNVGMVERPLRASTPKGERVSLARSEFVPEGTTLDLTFTLLGDAFPDALLDECLDYGKRRGLLCWRNAGWGSFSYEELDV